MEPVIAARGVVKRYGPTTALAGASVDVGPGVTGLLGANGAGKTTLIGLLLGLHRPDAGTLQVLGLDPAEAGPEVRARVGYAPEHHDLPADMSAYDLVRHLAEVHGLPRKEATPRAADVLWQVGLGEERLRPVGTMSTGQRQRVKLAAAIAHDPRLVLLDEPTDGLDPTQRDAMLALIRRIGGEFGMDIVLSSHLLEEVERTCDRAVILAGGEVAAAGTLDELRGAGSGAVLELDDGAEDVAAGLGAWRPPDGPGRIEVVRQGSRLDLTSTTLSDEELFDAVRDVLADRGAALRRLLPRRTSLEDVYLRVGSALAEPAEETGPALDQPAAAAPGTRR